MLSSPSSLNWYSCFIFLMRKKRKSEENLHRLTHHTHLHLCLKAPVTVHVHIACSGTSVELVFPLSPEVFLFLLYCFLQSKIYFYFHQKKNPPLIFWPHCLLSCPDGSSYSKTPWKKHLCPVVFISVLHPFQSYFFFPDIAAPAPPHLSQGL